MKKINIKNKNTFEYLNETKFPHFIGSWKIENDTLCNEIIAFFEENKNLQNQGSTASGKDLTIKKTTDITIAPNDLQNIKFKCINNYIEELHKCFVDYQNQWPFLKDKIKSLHIGEFNIQRYFPGDHYAKIHCERLGIQNIHRMFAWMTYLNDVDDGGVTNFSHYAIKVKPEIGKTLIWPAEWTHAHSGEVLNSGVKYIVTGWMHFANDS